MFRLGLLGNPRGIARLRAAAAEWNERVPHPSYGPRVRYILPAFLDPWFEPRRRPLERLRRVADELLEVGDLEYYRVARLMRANHAALVGAPLDEVNAQFRSLVEEAVHPSVDGTHVVRRSLEVLCGETAPDLQAQTDQLQSLLAAHPGWYAHEAGRWVAVLYLLGEHPVAHRFAESITAPLYGTLSSSSHIVDYTLFRGLAAVSCLRGRQQVGMARSALKEARKKLRRWSRFNGDFVHMARLLDADVLAGRGRHAQALRGYESCAQRAESHGYVQHAALAHELRSSLLSTLKRRSEAARELQRALALYEQWGAHAKVGQLRSRART
jgi:hypothetical protein